MDGALAAELGQPAQEGSYPVLAPCEVLSPDLIASYVNPVGGEARPLDGGVGRGSSGHQVFQMRAQRTRRYRNWHHYEKGRPESLCSLGN